MTHEPPRKHLLLIHGRSTKPGAEEKRALVRRALLEGLARVDADAARSFDTGEIKFSFIYYGDINNQLLIDQQPELMGQMTKRGDGYVEPVERYTESLSALLERPSDEHTREVYRRIVAAAPNRSGLDRVAGLLGPAVSRLQLTLWFARSLFPDVSAYFTSRKTASEIRYRLQQPLHEALRRGDDIALVSHSLGCVVAYDVLWKLSHMREYEDVHRDKVNLWLTLGSPLGDPAVRRSLYDSNEPADGLYPTNVRDWVNVSAWDDYVCRRYSAARPFARMVKWGRIESLSDQARIYNFWVGRNGTNPHKLYGYVNHPQVAARLASWMRQS